MKKTIPSLLFLLLFIINPSSAIGDPKKTQSKSSSKLKKIKSLISPNSISDLLDSNVLIEVNDTTGSGFFISRNLIVTNYHVIKDSHEKESIVFFKKQNDKRGAAIIGLIDKENDLALLRSFSHDGKPLKLGDSSKVQLLDDVIIVGSPQGLQGTVSKGIVSAKRKKFRGFEDVMQTSAPISQGSSGSPVLLKDTHEVVGVAMMIHTAGQNLNFFVPINKLKELMRANKEKMHDLTKNLGRQYLKAAKGGNKKAQAFLGWSLYRGINWKKDYKRATYWLSKTKEPIFYTDLAQMYLEGGFGLKKDYRKARAYVSCSLESYEKSRLLGLMYLGGMGFATDKDKALNHFLKAIKQGGFSSFDFEIVGNLFLDKGNFLKAAYWFSLAFITMYGPHSPKNREKIVGELLDYSISKLTQSQATLILPRVKGALQGKYPIVSQNISLVNSPPCVSSSFKPQMAQFIEAAKSGDFLKVSNLIKSGIDVNTRDIDGTTPLMWAAINGHIEVINLLIKAGAKVNAKNLTLTNNENIKEILRKALKDEREKSTYNIGEIKTKSHRKKNTKDLEQEFLDDHVKRNRETSGGFTSQEIEQIFNETEMQE